MRAAVHTKYGPPDVVRVIDLDMPVPKANDILVKIHVTTVNRTDAATRAGKPFFARIVTGIVRPRATVLGNEFAGTVEAVGQSVTSMGIGDRVFGYNEGPFGAHAEYLTIPENGSVVTMPPDSTFEEAAASTEGAHYALGFINKAKIGSGQDVLVNGATGAIGSAAVQLLKARGANVTAVCGTKHLAMVTEMGASRVIDYERDDFTQDEQVYDVVLDAVGKSTFGRCRRLLKPRGIYMSSELGPLAQNPVLALVSMLSRGRKVMFAIPTHDQAMMAYFRELLMSGALKPLIDRRYSLDEIVEAYRYVETGEKIGNVEICVERSEVA